MLIPCMLVLYNYTPCFVHRDRYITWLILRGFKAPSRSRPVKVCVGASLGALGFWSRMIVFVYLAPFQVRILRTCCILEDPARFGGDVYQSRRILGEGVPTPLNPLRVDGTCLKAACASSTPAEAIPDPS